MASLIKGKQLENNTVTKEKLNLSNPSVGKDPVTKSYLESKINPKLSFGTIQEFRDGFDVSVSKSFQVIDAGKEGFFVYDPTDTTSVDDGSMVLVKVNRRYKRKFEGYVRPEWFGISSDTNFGNETANMMKAVNYLKSKGGGILKLANKIYSANLVWNGSDNINIEGIGSQSGLSSATVNEFALKIEAGYPAQGAYIKNCRFYGRDDKTRHGIFLNCGSSYSFDNVLFNGCGIALLSNGTIDNTFNTCKWQSNSIACMFTTLIQGQTTITNIGKETNLTLNVTPAFYDTQPSEQTFTNCHWAGSEISIFTSYKGVNYESANNIKIFGGAIQDSALGICCESYTTLLNYGVSLYGVWIENVLGTKQPTTFNGKTYPLKDLYINGGFASITNGGLSAAYAGNNTIIDLQNVTIVGESDFTTSGSGSFIGRNITGDNIFFPHHVESGINDHNARSFGFYTNPKLNKNKAFLKNKIYSETHGVNSVTDGLFGEGVTITKVAGGVMDSQCWEVKLPPATGFIGRDMNIKENKIYVSVFNIRSKSTPFELLAAGTYVPVFTNIKFPITSEWKSVCIVGRGVITSGGETPSRLGDVFLYNIIGTPVERTFQISGWQVLEFDTIEEAYSFMKSSDFVSTQTEIIEHITPEFFGAKGDGITDDTSAFIKAFSSSNVVHLLSKNYLANVTVPAGKILRGSGHTDGWGGNETITRIKGTIILNNSSTLENLNVEYSPTNGVEVRGIRVTVKDVGSHRNAGHGFSLEGNDNHNLNLFRIEGCSAVGNNGKGFVYDNATADPNLPNCNAGTTINCSARENQQGGFYINRAIDNVFLSTAAEVNIGYGVELGQYAKGHQFLSHYEEANTLGEFLLRVNSKNNTVYAPRSGSAGDGVIDQGTNNTIYGKLYNIPLVNKLAFKTFEIFDADIVGRWNFRRNNSGELIIEPTNIGNESRDVIIQSSGNGTAGLAFKPTLGGNSKPITGVASLTVSSFEAGIINANSTKEIDQYFDEAEDGNWMLYLQPQQPIPSGIMYNIYFKSLHTIGIRFANLTAANIDLGTIQFVIKAIKIKS